MLANPEIKLLEYTFPGEWAKNPNMRALESFRTEVIRAWRHALMRRSQRHRMNWERMGLLAERWVPKARIQHPWPEVRLDATTRDRSPVR